MILQALVNYYERLAKQENVLPAYGWSSEQISYCIVLNDDGSIHHIDDIRLSQQVKNKTTFQLTIRIKLFVGPCVIESYS